MGRTYAVYDNPYKGLAESIITSKVLDMSDAFDWSYSWRTTSGVTSAVTMDISNAKSRDSIQEKQWSRWTAFGHTAPPTPSGSSTEFPPLGVRFVRFRRQISAASIAIDVNKLCNG